MSSISARVCAPTPPPSSQDLKNLHDISNSPAFRCYLVCISNPRSSALIRGKRFAFSDQCHLRRSVVRFVFPITAMSCDVVDLGARLRAYPSPFIPRSKELTRHIQFTGVSLLFGLYFKSALIRVNPR